VAQDLLLFDNKMKLNFSGSTLVYCHYYLSDILFSASHQTQNFIRFTHFVLRLLCNQNAFERSDPAGSEAESIFI
jgi:hypothetical protein